jgi:DNA-binding beta-propeller fold protein YncE
MQKSKIILALAVGTAVLARISASEPGFSADDNARGGAEVSDRSPVDLVLSADETWLVTANQTSHSLSLVRVADGAVVQELSVGQRPTALALLPEGRGVAVTCRDSNEVVLVEAGLQRLRVTATIQVGGQPWGLACDAAGGRAYVALAGQGQVAVLDLAAGTVLKRIEVGPWPRYLSLSPDGTRLAVGISGDRGVAVVDTQTHELLYVERFAGLNVGQMQISADGRHVYFPWMVYRRNPITAANIRLGWVLASRIARVRMDGPARREAFSLDPSGQAIADPHGLALTHDESRILVTASGTQELVVFRAAGLPWKDYGSTDHIERQLLADQDRFFRIPLGGRPMGLRLSSDDRRVYVANYLENCVQIVDLAERRVTRELPLGGPAQPSLARRGEAIFHDGRRSLDQWYSCHSCHYEGGTNNVAMDTLNDGTPMTFKTVLPLYHVTETAPWTWHGWQNDLTAAMNKSLTDTMLGPPPGPEDAAALIAYLRTLQPPPNPYRRPDGSLSAVAERGRAVFQSEQAGCAACHSGPYLTDGHIHDMGTGGKDDHYAGYNTPSLRGVYRKVQLLHDGRCTSLDELLRGPHNPQRVTGLGELTDQQREELIAYLKSL